MISKNSVRPLLWTYDGADDQGAFPIYICITIDRKQRYLSIGKKVTKSMWLKKSCQIKAEHPLAAEINATIFNYRQEINEYIVRKGLDKEPITAAGAKAYFENKWRPAADEQQRNNGGDDSLFKQDMLKGFDEIFRLMATGECKTSKGKRYSRASMDNMQDAKKIIAAFYTSKKLSPSYAKVDKALFASFTDYLFKRYSKNTICVYIKTWKKLLTIAHENEWHSNTIFRQEWFHWGSEDVFRIYLDETKLKALYDVAFEPGSVKDIIRDWAILDAYLGIRSIDVNLIGEKNFSNGYFHVVNEKTDVQLAVPLHPLIKAILKKWNGLPPRRSNTTFSRWIKPIAKEAKLNEQVIYSRTVKGVRQDFYYKEWEVVSYHTFRRSFITNCLRAGIPELKVMVFTGIKSIQTLKKYDKATPHETAMDMKNHAFFKSS